MKKYIAYIFIICLTLLSGCNIIENIVPCYDKDGNSYYSKYDELSNEYFSLENNYEEISSELEEQEEYNEVLIYHLEKMGFFNDDYYEKIRLNDTYYIPGILELKVLKSKEEDSYFVNLNLKDKSYGTFDSNLLKSILVIKKDKAEGYYIDRNYLYAFTEDKICVSNEYDAPYIKFIITTNDNNTHFLKIEL